MALLESLRAELRKERVQLWLPPYTLPAGAGAPAGESALAALAASYATRLQQELPTVETLLEELRQHAVAKLRAKTRVTVLGKVLGPTAVQKELRAELDAADTGATARAALCRLLGVPRLRVIMGGRALQDEATLEQQGWRCDQDRGGEPLRLLLLCSGGGGPEAGPAASPAAAPTPAAGVAAAAPCSAAEAATAPCAAAAAAPGSASTEAKRLCPKGHELVFCERPHPDFTCDRCNASLPVGKPLAGCRICNYDLCETCFREALEPPCPVRRIREAAEQLTATGFGDFELSDASTGRLVPVPPAARQALVTAIAMHARGRELLSGACRAGAGAGAGAAVAAAVEALEFLAEADACFERCRAAGTEALLAQLENFGQLQLDICWAYALLGDTDRLPDAEARLQVAERMIRRQVDSNFLTLAEVKAEQGHTLPPEVLPSVRLWLLRGIARRCRGDTVGARGDLERAALFLQALKVDQGAVSALLALGASRVQAVAALRRCGGDADRAAAELLAAAPRREAARRERKAQRKYGLVKDGSYVDPVLVQQLMGMGIEEEGAAEAVREANNDLAKALDVLQAKRAEAERGSAGSAEPVDELALASLLSLGFEEAAAEAALRAAGPGAGMEAALLQLTAAAEAASGSAAPAAPAAEAGAAATAGEPAASQAAEQERPAKAARTAQREQDEALEEARRVVERELGGCLRRKDMEDDVAGAWLEEEEALLQQHLSSF